MFTYHTDKKLDEKELKITSLQIKSDFSSTIREFLNIVINNVIRNQLSVSANTDKSIFDATILDFEFIGFIISLYLQIDYFSYTLI